MICHTPLPGYNTPAPSTASTAASPGWRCWGSWTRGPACRSSAQLALYKCVSCTQHSSQDDLHAEPPVRRGVPGAGVGPPGHRPGHRRPHPPLQPGGDSQPSLGRLDRGARVLCILKSETWRGKSRNLSCMLCSRLAGAEVERTACRCEEWDRVRLTLLLEPQPNWHVGLSHDCQPIPTKF